MCQDLSQPVVVVWIFTSTNPRFSLGSGLFIYPHLCLKTGSATTVMCRLHPCVSSSSIWYPEVIANSIPNRKTLCTPVAMS